MSKNQAEAEPLGKNRHPQVGLLYEPSLVRHQPPQSDFHLERPERITAIYHALMNSGLVDLCQAIRGRHAKQEELLRTHHPTYLEQTFTNLTSKNPYFASRDMYANPDTLDCSLLAAGSAIELTQSIIDNQIDSGFALVRPPGHHATCSKYMGFCFFNNVMLAALAAIKQGKKVLVVDWDVHLGNGSLDIIENVISKEQRPNLMFFSIHRYDRGFFYPGGKQGESGVSDDGRIIKVGFDGPKGDRFYLETFEEKLLPRAQEFAPDLILVSCGLDAAKGDPLGQCEVTPGGYYLLTQILQEICPKIAMILEGGYNLKAISESAVACLKALLGLEFEEEIGSPGEIIINGDNPDHIS